jgi:hypothetical protein
MHRRPRLLLLACVLASLLVPGLASASIDVGLETRVRGLDLGNAHSIGAPRPVTLGTHQGYGLAYDDIASGSLLAARGASAVGRSLDDVIADPRTFGRWLKHGHPTDKPLSAADAQKVWDKLLETGRTPRLDAGHPGTKWDMPHINVDGAHIPVGPDFTPPVP